MIELSPEDILNHLKKRLDKTIRLRNKAMANDVDDELETNIYFNFYFNFSSAIETTIHNILIMKYQDLFLKKQLKIKESGSSKYYTEDIVYLLIGDFVNQLTANDYNDFFKSIPRVLKSKTIDLPFKKMEISSKYDFKESYKAARKTRNMLAHGLSLINVEYNDRMLENFIYAFWVIFKYYELLCKKSN